MHRGPLEHSPRGDVDDLAILLFAHDRHHGSGHLPDATDIDTQDSVEFIQVDVFEPLTFQVAKKRRIVHQHINCSVGFKRGGHQRLDLCIVGNIGLDPDGVAARTL